MMAKMSLKGLEAQPQTYLVYAFKLYLNTDSLPTIRFEL